MDQPFHLVLVNGFAIPQEDGNGNPKAFFSQAFPRAIIDEFSFLEPSIVEWRLQQRAHALLEQLWKARDSAEPLPLVFLSQGLGTFVVKQALVSALEEPRYRGITLNTSTAFFFGVPHKVFSGLTWEHLYLRLLSAFPMLPSHLLKSMDRLVAEIEDISEGFSIVPCGIDITDYYDEEKNLKIDKRGHTWANLHKFNTESDWQHEKLWNFSTREVIANDVCKRLLATRNIQNQTHQEFLSALCVLDPQTHKLYPSRSAVDALDSFPDYEAVEAWKSDSKVRILHVGGVPGSGTTVLAIRTLESLLEQQASGNTAVLTFSFDKYNLQARGPFNLYLSLCRQLLSFQPKLFCHISSAVKFWTRDNGFTTGCLWVLFRSMLMSVLNQGGSVFCIIGAFDECITSPTETVEHMEELVKTGNGRFKLLLSRVDGKHEVQGDEAGQCCDIEVDPTSKEMVSWKKRHVLSRIRYLSQENAAWVGLEDIALDQMQSLPASSTYLVITLNMTMLKWTTKGCTRRGLKERLEEPPKCLRDCYSEALRTIKAECRTWALIALRWIAWAVRSLRPAELAVAVAVGELLESGHDIGDSNNVHSIDDMIRRDIIGDLRHCMAPLIKVEENQVRFIHDTFREFLFESANRSAMETSVARLQRDDDQSMPDDEHCHILHQCLKYLSGIGQLASMSVNSDGWQNSLSLSHEYGLLRYATLHWPEHFQQSTSRGPSRKHVLHFLSQDEWVAAWAGLYHHLKPTLDSFRSRSILLDTPLKIVCNFGLTSLLDPYIESAKSMEGFEDQLSISLDLAVEHGHHDTAQTLLSLGARSPNALGLAASGGFISIVNDILSADPSGLDDSDQSPYTPLHRATFSGHKHVVSLLLEKIANPDLLAPLRTTGSPYASDGDLVASAPHSDLDSDSNTDTDTDTGTGTDMDDLSHSDATTDELPIPNSQQTSLQLAARTGQREIAEILLRNGANVHAKSSLGYDALMYAASGGFVNIVDLLLHKGADATMSGTDENTALHLAAAHGHVKVVQHLLQSSSIVPNLTCMVNKSGMTPIDLAAREGHLDVLNCMFNAMECAKDIDSVGSTNDEDERLPSTDPVVKAPERSHSFNLRPRRRSTTGLSQRKKTQEPSSRPEPPSSPRGGHKSALEWAAESGHYHVVQALLARKEEVNLIQAAQDHRGNTALHLAAESGHSTTVEALLKNQKCAELFPVNSRTMKQLTPIHMAAKAGHVEVIKTLLAFEAQPDLRDRDGRTALHHAAMHGHLKCLDELRSKSDPLQVDNRQRTALHLAARRGYFAVVERLCEDQDAIWMKDDDNAVALDFVVRRGKLHEVEAFVRRLKNGPSFAPEGLPLHVAARRHHLAVLRYLLDQGWKCDARSSNDITPLHVAVKSNFHEGVKALLENPDCDVNAVDAERNSPLHLARDADVVTTLLRFGANNDEKNSLGETPLLAAVYQGEIAVLAKLLMSIPRPDVNVQDCDGWSALHAAFDDSNATQLLLDHDANPNVFEDIGRTPLALAIGWGYLSTATLLLGAKADPDLADGFSNSPLGLIMSGDLGNSLDRVEILAKNGADLLAEDEEGLTILHLAARQGERAVFNYIIDKADSQTAHADRVSEIYGSVLCECLSVSNNFDPEMAKKLVAQGVDVNNMTKFDITPLQAACAMGTVEAIEWLLGENVQVNTEGGRYGTALCAAVESEIDAEQKAFLLLNSEAKADIDLSGESQATALQRATFHGNAPLVDLLLQKGANVNLSKGILDTPLNCAIAHQGIGLPIITEMVKKGADLKKGGVGGKLPVHTAAIHDRLDVMKALRNAGADARAKDEHGLSPLMHGLLNNSVSVVRYLVCEQVYDQHEVDPIGQTPLMVATIQGDRISLPLLLQNPFVEPLLLNARDFQGKTALAHAVCIDHLEFVKTLLESKADPSISDYRDNSPLYWATRMASQETTEAIISAMENLENDPVEHWSIAIHGAVASSKREALERLLHDYNVDPEYARLDGWTPLHTAQRYSSDRMESILRGLSIAKPLLDSLSLQRPSRWHPQDTYPGIVIDAKNPSTLTTTGGLRFVNPTMDQHCGVARADYPMLPLINDHVYYFEVTLASVGTDGMVAVGFCEDRAPLYQMLGWNPGSWGFHSDNGRLYEDGRLSWRGIKYHEPYGEKGVTIGCGVNFARNTAFYTKDGEVIGHAFEEIRGKLYPAVSMEFSQEGWQVSAVFPGKDGKSKDFVFKGDFEGDQTLALPELLGEGQSSSDDSESDW